MSRGLRQALDAQYAGIRELFGLWHRYSYSISGLNFGFDRQPATRDMMPADDWPGDHGPVVAYCNMSEARPLDSGLVDKASWFERMDTLLLFRMDGRTTCNG